MPFSTNCRGPPVTIRLSWQHAHWKGMFDKAWNKVCIAERECCTSYLSVRPNLFSRMEHKWTATSLPRSLLWPKVPGCLLPLLMPCRNALQPQHLTSLLSLGRSPIQCQPNGIFPCFPENLLCHLLQAGFSD